MSQVWGPMQELLKSNVDSVRRADGSIEAWHGPGGLGGLGIGLLWNVRLMVIQWCFHGTL